MSRITNTLERRRKYSTMRIVICDDHPEFSKKLLSLISNFCSKRDWLLEYDIFSSTTQLIESNLSETQVVFLDIEMPDINGIEAAVQLRTLYPDIILVFVTGWLKYAPEGYRANAFRYLLKDQIHVQISTCMEDIFRKLHETNEHICLKQRDRDLELALKDIGYIEGTAYRSVLIHTATGASFECIGKLIDFEKELSIKGFLRIQKSFLVNMSFIERISNYNVYLKDKSTLRASQKNYSTVTKQYLLWKGQRV